MEYLKLIEDLTNAEGAPGFEDKVIEVLATYKGDYDFQVDNLKNAYLNIGTIDPNKPTIMLDSHTDEVAFMVKAIDDRGLLLIQPLGGWIPAHISAQIFKVRNSQGHYYPAVCTSKPIHFMTEAERHKELTFEDLKMDVGAKSRQEVIDRFKITVGQPIVPATQFSYNEDNQVMLAKAFDNRIGCAVAMAVMDQLKDQVEDLPFNLVAAFAAQEEVGLRGAVVTSKRVQPTMALVFEGTPADDFTSDEYQEQGRLGYGPQLRHRDNSYIANEWLLDRITQIADQEGINLQHAVRQGGGTNAGSIHLSELGVPVATLGTPSRYAHTNYCYCSYEDFKACVALTVAFLKALSAEDLAQFDLQSK